jgi:NADH:ubiquinone oxidoreductase subunit E
MAKDMSIETLAPGYRERRDLLSLVKEVQRGHSYLSAEDIQGIATAWDIPVGEVYGIVTFYSFLSPRPQGKNIVKVCGSPPCCLKGCDSIGRAIQTELGIGPGETTPDGNFSLMHVNCVGACDGAPAMMVNDDVYQDVTTEGVKDILAKYHGAKDRDEE